MYYSILHLVLCLPFSSRDVDPHRYLCCLFIVPLLLSLIICLPFKTKKDVMQRYLLQFLFDDQNKSGIGLLPSVGDFTWRKEEIVVRFRNPMCHRHRQFSSLNAEVKKHVDNIENVR